MGKSKEGWCKLCKSPFAPALNKLIVDGKNAAEAGRLMEPFGLSFNRATFYSHKDHVTHPLLTAVEKSQKNPVIVPKSTHAVLEAVRDIGMQRAIENPEEVTVDHALKAAGLLQQAEKKGESFMVVLAKAVQADPMEVALIGNNDTYEGEYEEVSD